MVVTKDAKAKMSERFISFFERLPSARPLKKFVYLGKQRLLKESLKKLLEKFP